MQWLNGQCTGLQIERSGFKTRPGRFVVFWVRHFTLTMPLSAQE